MRPIGELDADADGIISLGRKNENAYAESPGGEQEFPTGDFTVEARFRAGPITRSYGVVASKNEKAGGKVDFYLLVQPTGEIAPIG